MIYICISAINKSIHMGTCTIENTIVTRLQTLHSYTKRREQKAALHHVLQRDRIVMTSRRSAAVRAAFCVSAERVAPQGTMRLDCEFTSVLSSSQVFPLISHQSNVNKLEDERDVRLIEQLSKPIEDTVNKTVFHHRCLDRN